MTVEIRATPLANKIIEGLSKKARNAYDQFAADLAARGCAALAYRLSGGFLDHLCVVHLTGQLRVIVAFESPEIAYVVLIGNHNRDRPPQDVYQQLYELAGHHPSDQAGRDKPPCCDTDAGEPPVDAAQLDGLLTSMRRFRAPDICATPGRRRTSGLLRSSLTRDPGISFSSLKVAPAVPPLELGGLADPVPSPAWADFAPR